MVLFRPLALAEAGAAVAPVRVVCCLPVDWDAAAQDHDAEPRCGRDQPQDVDAENVRQDAGE